MVRVGFVLPHVGPDASSGAIDQMCRAAEELGADSLWVIDHIAIPFDIRAAYPYAKSFPVAGDTPWWDCLSVLAYAAARTTTVELGTGVLVLPLRHPLDTAKRIATIDVLSHGRVVFGVGAGWMADEFDALGLTTFAQRGAVTDEQLAVIKAAWCQAEVTYDGDFYRFAGVGVTPKPHRRPHPPVLIGGNSTAAMRRAVALGDGWHAMALSPDRLADRRAELTAMAVAAGRAEPPTTSMFYPIVLTEDPAIRDGLDDDLKGQALFGTKDQVVEELRRYRRAGLDHLMTVVSRMELGPGADPVGGMTTFLREVWPQVHEA